MILGYGFRETLAPPVNQKQADMFTGGVMFNVPIWHGSKIKPKIREEQAKQGAAKDAHQSPGTSWRRPSRTGMPSCSAWRSKSRSYDQGIIPQARQAVGASLASYQVGSLAFESALSEPDRRL